MQGKIITYATPAGHASAWTFMTNELPFVYQALARQGVTIHTTTNLLNFANGRAELENLFNRTPLELEIDSIVVVGHREPNDVLYQELMSCQQRSNGQFSINLLGDALAPGAIVHAVHSGHGFARSLVGDETIYLRDEPIVPVDPMPAFPLSEESKFFRS